MPIEGIIFDLDGTLVDSIGGIAYSCNAICEKYRLPTHSVSDYKNWVGWGLRRTFESCVPINVKNSPIFDDMFEELMVYYANHVLVETQPYDGVLLLLEELDRRHIPWGVNTNKSHHIAGILYQELFGHLHGLGCIGPSENVPKKPAPNGAVMLMEGHALMTRTLYIGDSEVDIETAVRANMIPVSVSWGFRPLELLKSHNPKYIIHKPEDILNLLGD